MDSMENIKYWRELSDYDIDTAQAMLVSERYLYVGFMCHQSIEKILKAYHCHVRTDMPPYIHSLSRLAEKTGIDKAFTDAQLDLIDILEPLNIEARYPSYKDELLKSLSKEKCESILYRTKELQRWIKDQLSK